MPSKSKKLNIKIGISGWTYPDWRGVFYPKGVTAKNELSYASRVLNSIEVNGTFYSMQKPHTFEKWYQDTPEGFTFALKGPKYITHKRRLKEVKTPLANFFASGVLLLKDKLGPILWQLPPNMIYNEERLKEFLALLPHTTKDACKLARSHSEWMKERAYLKTDKDRPILHALEVRHQSFVNKDCLALLRKHKVAIVVGDTAGRWPLIEEVTSNFVYIRLHGDETLYPQGYTQSALQTWATKIKKWASKVTAVYAFCDNDHKTAAPQNAQELSEILKLTWSSQHAKVEPKRKRKAA